MLINFSNLLSNESLMFQRSNNTKMNRAINKELGFPKTKTQKTQMNECCEIY